MSELESGSARIRTGSGFTGLKLGFTGLKLEFSHRYLAYNLTEFFICHIRTVSGTVK